MMPDVICPTAYKLKDCHICHHRKPHDRIPPGEDGMSPCDLECGPCGPCTSEPAAFLQVKLRRIAQLAKQIKEIAEE